MEGPRLISLQSINAEAGGEEKRGREAGRRTEKKIEPAQRKVRKLYRSTTRQVANMIADTEPAPGFPPHSRHLTTDHRSNNKQLLPRTYIRGGAGVVVDKRPLRNGMRTYLLCFGLQGFSC